MTLATFSHIRRPLDLVYPNHYLYLNHLSPICLHLRLSSIRRALALAHLLYCSSYGGWSPPSGSASFYYSLVIFFYSPPQDVVKQDGVLDTVAGHEVYCFLDGFSGYNQIRMHPADQEKTTFVIEWGVFVAVVMMFGLKTAPSTFQRIIMEIFGEYIPTFMHVFLDDFAVYSR